MTTGTDAPIVSVAPEANGAASLDLENNDLTGVETVVPSPDNDGQLRLDGLLALTAQADAGHPGQRRHPLRRQHRRRTEVQGEFRHRHHDRARLRTGRGPGISARAVSPSSPAVAAVA